MQYFPGAPARLRAPLVLSAFLGASLLGAGASASAAGTPPGGSWVRAADLLAGGPQLQVTLSPADGASGAPIVLAGGPADGQATDYRSVAPGTYAVTVRADPAPAGAALLVSSTYTATAGGAVTLAALGTAQAPRLAVVQDDLTPPAAGAARVRVLPALSNAAPVTVAAENGPTIATGAVFGQPTPYASVPAGAWQLSVRSGAASAVRSADLTSGAIYTVLVVDGAAGAVQATVLQDAAGVAVAAPTGGVQTGGGGTATDVVGTSPAARDAGLGALAGLALLGGVVIRRRRLPVG